MNTIERLQSIVKKRTVTSADKDFIREQSLEYGVEFVPVAQCANCYQDQAIIILKHIKDNNITVDGSENITTAGLSFKKGADIRWRGIRVNTETITAEIKAGMLEDGLHKYFTE